MWLLKNKYIPILLLIIMILPALWGLIHGGFFVSDDGNWMVIRFSAFYEALRSGQFPVRFLPRLNFGYGYPVADFLYPLFMYLAVPIKIGGISFVNTIKIIFGLGIITSGIFTYFWLQKLFSKQAAFVGALVYMLFPYHVWDMYHRGSVGEILALAIVPLILWQIERKDFLLTIFAISLLILAHNTLALLFLPIIVIYLFVRKSFSWQYIVLILFYALGISAFFWIPALFDRQFTVFDTIHVSDFFSYFSSTPTWELLGIISLFVVIEGIFALLKKQTTKLFWFFFLLTILSIFFVLPVSQPIWTIIPGKNLIQFPFRILSLTMLSICFLSAYAISVHKRNKIVLIGIIVIISYATSYQFIFPKEYSYQPDTFYSTNQDSTTVKNEYMPIFAKNNTSKAKNIEMISGEGVISQVQSRGTNIRFITTITKSGIIQLPIIYFPGWVVTIDNMDVPIRYTNPNGLIQLGLSQGIHTIHAYFTETHVRALADGVSVFSLLMTICVAMVIKKYAKH